MIDYLRHMAIFSYVAENGSFSVAARILGIAPSRVSEAVSKLEQHVGATLLYRTTRKISLTSEGRELYTHVSSMVKNAETGLNVLNAIKIEPSGTINISAPSFISNTPLADAIARFVETHQKTLVSISFTDLDVNPIKDGFDLSIRGGAFDDKGLSKRKLGELERIIVAGSGYVQQHSQPQYPKDLKGWDWITYRHQKRVLQLKSTNGQLTKLVIEEQSKLNVDSLDALFAFTKMNLGATVLPMGYAQHGIESGALTRLLKDWQLKPAQYYAVWPESSLQDSLLLYFVNFLENYLATETE